MLQDHILQKLPEEKPSDERRNRRHLIPMKGEVPDSETIFEMPQMSPEQPAVSPTGTISPKESPDQSSASPVKVPSPKTVREPPKYSRYGRLIKQPHRLDI